MSFNSRVMNRGNFMKNSGILLSIQEAEFAKTQDEERFITTAAIRSKF